MNVHGIYDTAAFMMTFENRQQYQQYLQHEAGMSGSIFGFSGGVKAAYGGSMQESSQQYMAMMDVDIDRSVALGWISLFMKYSQTSPKQPPSGST